ncbi:acetyl-CoA hydrolase [Mycobacterium sp. NBC_00419]|uniref:acetyl-CoA hydrolase/transferase C-terminal domain-containing protein n=1 Tax=Mycobacterium sp. NBC_00419 TaxID=2975989 RepID=UPI002E1B3F2A
MTAADLTAALRAAVPAGGTIAVGDGVGTLTGLDDGSSVGAVLSAAAREIGGVRLILGWVPGVMTDLDVTAFADVVVLMPGWGMRAVLKNPGARFVPTALTGIDSLLHTTLRPDALLTRLTLRNNAFRFCTEVSWQRTLIDTGVTVLAVLDEQAPAAGADCIDAGALHVIGHTSRGPVEVPGRAPEAIHDALADNVLRYVPAGASLQYGPGQLGTALLRRIAVPVHLDTGLLTDGVMELEQRGLLLGEPSATYLLGSAELYRWADGRPILRGIGYTHDIGRLRDRTFVAVNTAIEIDPVGQINCEGNGEKVVGGIGGHPDFCAAGRASRHGLSIIAVPSRVNERSPLVDALTRPTSTPAHDVDVIVTESGAVDLRGLDWPARRASITQLFDN